MPLKTQNQTAMFYINDSTSEARGLGVLCVAFIESKSHNRSVDCDAIRPALNRASFDYFCRVASAHSHPIIGELYQSDWETV
jgi:hypothetical protein